MVVVVRLVSPVSDARLPDLLLRKPNLNIDNLDINLDQNNLSIGLDSDSTAPTASSRHCTLSSLDSVSAKIVALASDVVVPAWVVTLLCELRR